MKITKKTYPDNYEFIEYIFETVVINSSIKSDFSVLLKSLKKAEFHEYENLIEIGYNNIMEKMKLKAKEKGCDAIYNFNLEVIVLYAGTWLLYAGGDGVKYG